MKRTAASANSKTRQRSNSIMASDYPLRRSRRDVQIAGVCGGLAEFFGLDVTTVRIVYVLASIFTAFAGVLIYIILWMIIPEREYD